MYKYKFIKTDQSISKLKKGIIKQEFLTILIIFVILDALLSLFWIKILKEVGKVILYVLVGFIIFQISTLLTCYKRYINKYIKSLPENFECSIKINEEGIEVLNEEGIMKFSWNVIQNIKIYKEHLFIAYKIQGNFKQIFLLDSFDADKDEINKQINKYKIFRR